MNPLALPQPLDEAGLAQDPQVTGNPRLALPQGSGQVRNAERRVRTQSEQPQATWLTCGAEPPDDGRGSRLLHLKNCTSLLQSPTGHQRPDSVRAGTKTSANRAQGEVWAIASYLGQSAARPALMDRFRGIRAWRVCKQGFDAHGVEAVGPMTELAGHRHRTLFLQHLAHLLRANRAQETGDPALTAAAFEAHGSAAEQPQV